MNQDHQMLGISKPRFLIYSDAPQFADESGAKWPKAATTNPIESTFATVRLRQRVTKGPGSRAAGVAMAFKLLESAERRWRAVNAPHLFALVRAGYGQRT